MPHVVHQCYTEPLPPALAHTCAISEDHGKGISPQQTPPDPTVRVTLRRQPSHGPGKVRGTRLGPHGSAKAGTSETWSRHRPAQASTGVHPLPGCPVRWGPKPQGTGGGTGLPLAGSNATAAIQQHGLRASSGLLLLPAAARGLEFVPGNRHCLLLEPSPEWRLSTALPFDSALPPAPRDGAAGSFSQASASANFPLL